MNTEVFKDISGYEGRYAVSNYGRVYSRISEKFLKQVMDKDGYFYVKLYSTDGKQKHEKIHRLVAAAFCKKKEGCDIVNHLDSDRRNNRASNLEWTDPKGNIQHSIEFGYRNLFVSFAREVNSKTIAIYKNGVFIGTLDGTGWSFEEVTVSDEDTA